MSKQTWRGVVKVQRELTTGREDATMLVTSRNGAIHTQLPMNQELLTRRWFGDQLKFYAYARLVGTIIHFDRKVSEPDW